jgi:hypothetical protein
MDLPLISVPKGLQIRPVYPLIRLPSVQIRPVYTLICLYSSSKFEIMIRPEYPLICLPIKLYIADIKASVEAEPIPTQVWVGVVRKIEDKLNKIITEDTIKRVQIK